VQFDAVAQERLQIEVAKFYDDPLGFVLWNYPWGTGSLTGRKPQRWQVEFLLDVGEQVRKNGFDGIHAVEALRYSTASGHGIGKSALVAWLIDWIQSTRPMSKGVVTANTGEQLRTKTWSELAKWHGMGLTGQWFTLTSGSGSMSRYHKAYREQWRVDAQTCREENSEAFAGLHAASSTPFYIFDEASAVPDKIFEVREGGLTDGEPMVFDFGNPTRNTGRFFMNMKGKFRHRYRRRHINSEDVEQTNKELFKQWEEDYGRDSDFYRVRVLGQFPEAGSLQFIPMSLYDQNVERDVYVGPHDPLIMGVDVARFGDDRSVIWMRHGRDCSVPGHKVYHHADTMHIAGEVARYAKEYRPDAVFIDGGGVGGGVIDRARQLGVDVIEIDFGGKPYNQHRYKDRRAEMWGRMRDALKEGVRLPDEEDLRTDLTSVEYGYTSSGTKIQLERKEDMKKRGLASPDLADALALTYVEDVVPNRPGLKGDEHTTTNSTYDPFDL